MLELVYAWLGGFTGAAAATVAVSLGNAHLRVRRATRQFQQREFQASRDRRRSNAVSPDDAAVIHKARIRARESIEEL